MIDYALGKLIDDVEKHLQNITPLSLSLIKQKLISFVKINGFIKNPYLFQLIAVYSAYSGKTKSAIIFLDKSRKISPCKDEMLCFNGGLTYLYLKKIRQAKVSVMCCLAINPDNTSCLRLLMEIYYVEKNMKKFYEIFDKLEKNTFRLHKYMIIAGIAIKHGDQKNAEFNIHYIFSQLILHYGADKGKSLEDSFKYSTKHLIILAKMTSPDSEKASKYFLERNIKSYKSTIKGNILKF